MQNKVLIFRSDYLPVSETFISDHIRSLKRYVPIVLCEKETAAKHRIPLMPHVIAKSWLQRKAFKHFGWSNTFKKLVSIEKPSLVHAHFLTDAAKILPTMERNEIPFVVTAHGYDATIFDDQLNEFPEGRLLLSRRLRLIKRVQKIICVSVFIRNELLKRGYPEEKLIVSHLGVDMSLLNCRIISSMDAKGILFVGRLVEKKGARYLLEAYATLPENLRINHPLIIIGDGPQKYELEAYAKKLNIISIFLGAQPRSVVIEKLKTASVFVFPSIRAENGDAEGMGVAIMEALALGVPVCIFDNQPMANLIQDRSAGLLANSKNAIDLALKIQIILQNPHYADDISKSGRKLAENSFDLFSNTHALESIYDSVCISKLKLTV
jgi:colanic acid/amylovoran biosynthesis glycosyltransferase